jgi:hypothetical protein
MNANVCQIPQVAEADIASLCTSCTRRGNCLREFAARTIGERMDAGTYQVQLLDECEDYQSDGSGKTRHGSLRPAMFEAKVKDLCCGCPEAKGCRKRSDLDGLADVSMRDGTFVHVSVIACKPAGLFQISEPSRK